jgi:hypothetical protein
VLGNGLARLIDPRNVAEVVPRGDNQSHPELSDHGDKGNQSCNVNERNTEFHERQTHARILVPGKPDFFCSGIARALFMRTHQSVITDGQPGGVYSGETIGRPFTFGFSKILPDREPVGEDNRLVISQNS